MIRIGLTGGIAVGKSTVTAYLRRLGYHVIDADDVSRTIVQKGMPALDAIREQFGTDMILKNGELNRSALAERIFSNTHERERLNQIMFPAIWREIDRQLDEYERQHPNERVVFVDAAILLESEGERFVDGVWLVHCEETLQEKRLMERSHLTRKEARQRIQSQWSFEEKAKRADRIFENNEEPHMLFQQVCDALKEIYESKSYESRK